MNYYCARRNMTIHERMNENTPCGGDYSEIFYFDNNGKPVDAKDATRFIIRECDDDGNLIKETYAIK